KKKHRTEHLNSIANDTHTLIFYEAPHKLRATLKDLLETLGNRRISICRELTKVYEEVICMGLQEAADYYREKEPKGEYVLIIEGKLSDSDEDGADILGEALEKVSESVCRGQRLADVCKQVAKEHGLKKSELYSRFLSDRSHYNGG
ncbi:MAG: 16S rRNA (cytidine(1402)-2'-O)-methyltransferase, partial [Oscillospiraceae bacterium]|nr:16S rRNA (cytidine(1402)-2'-O)-methyltransferase [Oscillospiraceae bacterium]